MKAKVLGQEKSRAPAAGLGGMIMNGTKSRNARIGTGLLGALLVLTVVGCGGSEVPPPLPPPPPPINNGFGGGYGGFSGGGGCGAVPLGQPGVLAIQATLSPNAGGQNQLTLILTSQQPQGINFGGPQYLQ